MLPNRLSSLLHLETVHRDVQLSITINLNVWGIGEAT
jgi:hypothetical protein